LDQYQYQQFGQKQKQVQYYEYLNPEKVSLVINESFEGLANKLMFVENRSVIEVIVKTSKRIILIIVSSELVIDPNSDATE